MVLAAQSGTAEYRVFPYEDPTLEPFEQAVVALNPLVAVKVRSAAVHAALGEVCVLLSLFSLFAFIISSLRLVFFPPCYRVHLFIIPTFASVSCPLCYDAPRVFCLPWARIPSLPALLKFE